MPDITNIPEENAVANSPDPNPIDIRKWLTRLEKSQKLMTDKFLARWKLARKRLRSELDVKKQKGGLPSHTSVNIAYSVGTNFVNGIFFRAPDVNLESKSEETREEVENTEVKINDYFKDNLVKKTFKRMIWDAYTGGFGAIYVDWEYEDYQSNEPATDEAGNQVTDEMGQPRMKPVVLKNGPVIKRIRPDLLRIPKGFDWDNPEDSPWIGFDVILPIEEIHNNQRLDQVERLKVTGQAYEDLSDSEKKSAGKDTSADMLFGKISYIFTKPEFPGDQYKLMIIAKECAAPLLMEPFDKGHEGFPIHPISFNPQDDDEPYPCGDVWVMESQLQAIDEWWIRTLNHIKKTNPKWLYLTKHISKETLQKLKSNGDLDWVGLEPKNEMPLANIVSPMQHPPVHPDNMTVLEQALRFVSQIGPSSGQSRGDQDPNVNTATEANIINQKESVDMDARVDAVRDLFVRVVQDLAGLFEQNLVGNTQVKGVTKDGQEFDRSVDRSGFTRNFVVPDVNIDSMQHPNKELYRAQLEKDMQTLTAFVEPILNKSNETVNMKFFVDHWFDLMRIKNADQAIVPLNIRNPNKEHEDFVFGKNPMGQPLPMIVQPQENHDEHLKEHQMVANDQIAAGSYEQLKPGFIQSLMQHIQETTMAQEQKNKNKPPAVRPKPLTGQQPPRGK